MAKHFLSIGPTLLFVVVVGRCVRSAEPIDAPPPIVSSLDPFDQIDESHIYAGVHFFPAVLERRYGPVEECEPEFYALRNSDTPGFDWSMPAAGWPYGGGYSGWGYGGYGYGYRFPYANYGFGLAAYNRYYYRPWYASPSPNVVSNRFPWYSPGGVGPNIYQPWYQSRNSLPWYSPYGIGPNIYTPGYSWQSYYPWYSSNGPGPNIYTPTWQYGGCFYW